MAKIPRLLMSPTILTRMIRDKKFVTAFPFLKNPPKSQTAAGCLGCNKSVNNEYDWHALKRSVAGLAKSRHDLMKKMLNASEVKVIYRTPGGKMKTLFF